MATVKKKAPKPSASSGGMLSLFDMPPPATPAKPAAKTAPATLLPLMLFDEPAPVAPKAAPVELELPDIEAIILPPPALSAPAVDPVFLSATVIGPLTLYTLLDEAGSVLYSGSDDAELSPLLKNKTVVHYFQPVQFDTHQPQPILGSICLGSWFARFNGQYASAKGDYQAKDLDFAIRSARKQAPGLADAFGPSIDQSPQALLLLWRWLVGSADRARVLATLFNLEQYYRGNTIGPFPNSLTSGEPETVCLPPEKQTRYDFRMLNWQNRQDGLLIKGIPEGDYALMQCTNALTFEGEAVPILSTPMGLGLVRFQIVV